MSPCTVIACDPGQPFLVPPAIVQAAERVAALPLTFSTRLAFGGHIGRQREYLDLVRLHGGGCLEKALLLAAELSDLDFRTSFVLGGFGQSRPRSDAEILQSLSSGASSDVSTDTQHVAVLVSADGLPVLVDASGGRVGCLLATGATARRLLEGRANILCSNIDLPLSYRVRSEQVIEAVLKDRLTNLDTIARVVRRAGLIIEGRNTVRVVLGDRPRGVHVFESVGALVERAPRLASLARPDVIEAATDALIRHAASGAHQSVGFILEEAAAPWGAGTRVQDNLGTTNYCSRESASQPPK